MDDIVEIENSDESALSGKLDECAFVYGNKFAKIAELPRTVAAANYSATINISADTNFGAEIGAGAGDMAAGRTTAGACEAETKMADSEALQEKGQAPQESRTRVHIDLGKKTGEKLSPVPQGKDRQLSADKKAKK